MVARTTMYQELELNLGQLSLKRSCLKELFFFPVQGHVPCKMTRDLQSHMDQKALSSNGKGIKKCMLEGLNVYILALISY